ncbi:MAG: hypothetical protein GY845_04260, partial [Planctomycetes bacterium]|nr:hypothetical protein [Planctomycetota bacterium]
VDDNHFRVTEGEVITTHTDFCEIQNQYQQYRLKGVDVIFALPQMEDFDSSRRLENFDIHNSGFANIYRQYHGVLKTGDCPRTDVELNTAGLAKRFSEAYNCPESFARAIAH